MCGGPEVPAMPDSKDLIAIIHPMNTSCSPPFLQPRFSGRLRLSNQGPGSTVSEFMYGEEHQHINALGPLNVRIHKFGQPLDMARMSDSASDYDFPNPVMHTFNITYRQGNTAGSRLNLGVGGDGIIGRTVSILDHQHHVLGQGIIGRI